jgi:cytochrome c5
MKNPLIFFILIAFAITTLAFKMGDDKPHGFYGANKCGMCHKKDADGAQLKKWEDSKHAKATELLKSEEADKLAGGKAIENQDCLKCHATGAGSDPKNNDKKFTIDGVQCEACHGAGKDYKSKKIMQDREKSVANGLMVWADDKAIEGMCLECHDMKNKPKGHAKGEWDFAKMYSTIKHTKPEGK